MSTPADNNNFSMNISVYGAGYVGLVTAACFAKIGHKVTCADVNRERIQKITQGICPIYEENLPELLLQQQLAGNLIFTDDVVDAIEFSAIHFIATGTPSNEDGSADLLQVFSVAKQIAMHTQKDCLIVTKSTVPVGTGDEIVQQIQEQLTQLKKSVNIELISNPEFLREGSAVSDFLNADRIIIGGEPNALNQLKSVYQPLTKNGIPLLCMSRVSAELAKYTANAMLACKVSFINQISRLAEKLGANIDEVREGISLDHRIGPHFLQAGIGYGGSCFPKDNRALIHTAKKLDIESPLLNAIEEINVWQKEWVLEKLNHFFNFDLTNLTIAMWGLSFKPGTDDLREASSLVIINALLKVGASLRLYDPVAMPAAKELITTSDCLTWCETPEQALFTCDALVIATEWPEFINFSLPQLKTLLGDKPLFDGRNCFSLSAVKDAKLAFYYSVGRPILSGKIYPIY